MTFDSIVVVYASIFIEAAKIVGRYWPFFDQQIQEDLNYNPDY